MWRFKLHRDDPRLLAGGKRSVPGCHTCWNGSCVDLYLEVTLMELLEHWMRLFIEDPQGP